MLDFAFALAMLAVRLLVWYELKENLMTNQSDNNRVLSRTGARTLTPEEIAHITGGQNQTFVFTHVILPDTTHD